MKKNVEVLIDEQTIAKRVEELGRQITADYEGKDLHCLGVLKGSFVFMADLLRHIDLKLSCDFLTISSYGDLTKSSGVVKILTDLTVPIDGRHLLVVEDIVDTGLTLEYLLENLRTRNPVSIRVASLLDKPAGRTKNVPVDYVGFEIPDKFVVGYGLDDAQFSRNLPFIGNIETPEEE